MIGLILFLVIVNTIVTIVFVLSVTAKLNRLLGYW